MSCIYSVYVTVVIKAVIKWFWFLLCVVVRRSVLEAALSSAFAVLASLSLTTLATFRSLAALMLYISFRFRNENTVGEFVFTGLRVDFHQFHFDLVAFLYSGILYGLKTFPVYL